MSLLGGYPTSSSSGRGCLPLGAVVMFILVVVVLSVRTCTSDYSRASRMLDRDPCRAAELLVDEVRRDTRSPSARSLRLLVSMESPCGVYGLIQLMDLPDGQWIGKHSRSEIAKELAQRQSGWTAPTPPYNPDASQEERAEQKRLWISWFNEQFPEFRGD